jgi:hypothetical protein
MIRVPDEVKHTMNHYSLQFYCEILSELDRIFLYPVDADKYIAGNSIAILLVRESENIGKQLVLQVSFVQLQKILIAAENKIDIPGVLLFFPNDKIQPFPDVCFILQGKWYALTEKLNWKTHILGIKPAIFVY